MAWKPIDGRGLSIDEFKKHVDGLNFVWKPSGIAVHNTGNPSLNPLKNHGSWHGSSIPPQRRVNEGLVSYYKSQGWSAGPHLFIDDEKIWLFTPLNTPGVHSPSWNGTKIGIEMVGDYEIEAFDSGPGAKVRDNTVAALAILHAKLGLDPDTIKLHREDPRTTHACPGKNVDKEKLIQRVINYMGEGGDHAIDEDEGGDTPPPSVPTMAGIVQVPKGDTLTLRALASASSDKLGSLPAETVLTILSESMNGETKWYRVKTPAGYLGWVSAKYIKLAGEKKEKVTRQFIVKAMMDMGWSREVGYGVASNAYQESSFDVDAVGDGGKAYGLFQWHGPRQELFKIHIGKDIRESTALEQMRFLDWELKNTEQAAAVALKMAKTAYDAGAQFSRLYERPKNVSVEAYNRGSRAQKWFDEDK